MGSEKEKKRITITGTCKVCQWLFSYQIDFDAVGDPDYVDWCTECLNPLMELKFPKCTPEEARLAKENSEKQAAICQQKRLDKKKKKNKNYTDPDLENIETEFLIYNLEDID